MILADGKVYDSSMQGELLERLEEEINRTRAKDRLYPETVIAAVEKLRTRILEGEFEEQIDALVADVSVGTENIREQIRQVLELLRRENLEYKLWTELGVGESNREQKGLYGEYTTKPVLDQRPLRVSVYPLGTLFHIAAGNVDGLPVYSVLEGLLTGNVNILKLPQADKGLSVEILKALLAIEPKLAPYVYVFDTPSEDIGAMKKMADLSDGIVVWGGDGAVRAVRQMAKPGTRLIEWGHKLGFAYISGYEDKERELAALAEHIVKTRQLLCSSCQTIFLDTEDLEDVCEFCEEFLPYLQEATDRFTNPEIGVRAEIALRRYSDEVEAILTESSADENKNDRSVINRKGIAKAYYGKGCSLTVTEDSELELSYMFGNCLVKRLPREKAFGVLRRHGDVLQTVGLICDRDKRKELIRMFASCGLTRIMRAGSQSDSFVGEAHDGEYPLAAYVRIVNAEP